MTKIGRRNLLKTSLGVSGNISPGKSRSHQSPAERPTWKSDRAGRFLSISPSHGL